MIKGKNVCPRCHRGNIVNTPLKKEEVFLKGRGCEYIYTTNEYPVRCTSCGEKWRGFEMELDKDDNVISLKLID